VSYNNDGAWSQKFQEHEIQPTLQEFTVYLIGKLNQKSVILAFGQFDHLIILDKLI
jgi:hypothetical protein